MKVNIQGRGLVYSLGINAPVKNIDLSEAQIRRILPVRSLQVYDAETNLLITPRNIDGFFKMKNEPVVEAPKKEVKKPVKKEASVEAVNDVIITEPTPVKEEPVEAPVEEEAVEEGIVVGEPVEEEDVPVADEDVEEDAEPVDEEPLGETEFVPKKKNKKRR